MSIPNCPRAKKTNGSTVKAWALIKDYYLCNMSVFNPFLCVLCDVYSQSGIHPHLVFILRMYACKSILFRTWPVISGHESTENTHSPKRHTSCSLGFVIGVTIVVCWGKHTQSWRHKKTRLNGFGFISGPEKTLLNKRTMKISWEINISCCGNNLLPSLSKYLRLCTT